MDINLHLLATVGELNRLKEVLSPFQNNDRALLKRIINRKDDKSSKTLLQVACDCGHTGVVQYLLSLGRDVLSINEVNKGGNSALSFACMGGAELVVKALLEADSSGGFDVDIYHKNNEGNTALFLAAQGGHYGITVHLLLHETKKRAAALPSSPALEQLAGGHNAYANERNRDGFTPLLAAAHAGHADTGMPSSHISLSLLGIILVNDCCDSDYTRRIWSRRGDLQQQGQQRPAHGLHGRSRRSGVRPHRSRATDKFA